MKKSDERKIILNSYLNLIKFLSQIYGANCEVVLHSIENDKVSIIAIENGEISDRKTGEEIREIGSRFKNRYKIKDFIVGNYERTSNKRKIKTNTFFIKDSSGELIGMLCINFDMTVPIAAKKFFDEFIEHFSDNEDNSDNITSSTANSIKEFTLNIIKDVIKDSGIPVERMTPEERIDILKILKEKGVFTIKGAVREVSKHLETSETSIYRYLKELD